jgi:hypothetical protein
MFSHYINASFALRGRNRHESFFTFIKRGTNPIVKIHYCTALAHLCHFI